MEPSLEPFFRAWCILVMLFLLLSFSDASELMDRLEDKLVLFYKQYNQCIL